MGNLINKRDDGLWDVICRRCGEHFVFDRPLRLCNPCKKASEREQKMRYGRIPMRYGNINQKLMEDIRQADKHNMTYGHYMASKNLDEDMKLAMKIGTHARFLVGSRKHGNSSCL